MIKKGGYVLILLFVTVFFVSSSKVDEWQKLYLKAVSTGAYVDKVEVEGRGIFNSDKSLVSLAKQFYEASGYEGKLKTTITKDEVVLTNNNFTFKIKNLSKENSKYASIILSQYVEGKNINNIRGTIYKGFSIFDIEPTFSYLLEGKYLKKMTIDEMKNKAGEILSLCGGKNVSGMEDRNLVSYIGYDPSINDKINILKNYVNLNIALRTDRVRGNTYLWVGCPVIPVEY